MVPMIDHYHLQHMFFINFQHNICRLTSLTQLLGFSGSGNPWEYTNFHCFTPFHVAPASVRQNPFCSFRI